MPLTYNDLGVSSRKEDVHSAIKNVDKGLFPGAFCKVIPDMLSDDANYCLIFHADGAGTKSIVAYLYWKETGDASVFKGIAQDALVMNVDDIACCGLLHGFIVSNTIGRNKFLIPGEIIAGIITGYEEFVARMQKLGIHMDLCGGETADVGDLVRTIIVDSTVMARGKRDAIIDTTAITPGDVLVGLSSTGKAKYETVENSGISSNGITLARHALIPWRYAEKYPEIRDPAIKKETGYAGKQDINEKLNNTSITIVQALLSPTRTYLPVLKEAFASFDGIADLKRNVHGIIHATGGGQTKCIKFGPGVEYIKDNLFPVPPIFSAIQEAGNVPWEEMYRVFNMGHRMEIACTEESAKSIINAASKFKVEARVIGHIDPPRESSRNRLTIQGPQGTFHYD
nr:AIR synthase-related protein [Candidatus Sigynarchaeota archaeon]